MSKRAKPPATDHGRHEADERPSRWKKSSPLIDLSDHKLRQLALSLTRACSGERERAIAIYKFVRRLPLVARRKWRLRTAVEVIEKRGGDAVDKATLLVALLRLAGLPARLIFAPSHGGMQRGLPVELSPMSRPIVEVWLAERWVRTDTFVFDVPYMTAARHRLSNKHEEYGYGISRAGALDWDGNRDAYVLGVEQEDDLTPSNSRSYRDARDFLAAMPFAQRVAWLARLIWWNAKAPRLDRTLSALRARQPRVAKASAA